MAQPHTDVLVAPGAHPRARKQARDLLERDIGLDIVLEALQLATAGEPDPSDLPDGAPYNPSKYKRLLNYWPGAPELAITTLLDKFGVTVFEVLALVDRRNIALAISKSAARSEEVLDAIDYAAKLRYVDCKRCAGEGKIASADTDPDADEGEDPLLLLDECPDCEGEGRLIKPGSVDAQKLHLSVHGIGPKNSGKGDTNVNVAVQQGVQVRNGQSASDSESAIVRVERIISQSRLSGDQSE
jgi:hypothetical protein